MATAVKIVRQFFPKVTEVKDARKSIWVEVTAKDSASANVKDHKSCAMAVACKRMQAADGVIVSMATAYVVKGRNAIRYKIPDSVSREIVSFDRKAGFTPGMYQLSAPSPSSRLGGSQQRGSQKHSGKGRKVPRRHHTDGIRTVLGTQVNTMALAMRS